MRTLVAQSLGLTLQGATDLQLLAGDANLLQLPENLLRHSCRQIDEAVVFADHDPADELAVQTRFIGDRTHDVAGLDSVRTADFDAVRLHVGIRDLRSLTSAALPGLDICSALDTRSLLARLAVAALHTHQ